MKEKETKPFTAYRTVRIDGEYDASRHDWDQAVEEAVHMAIESINAHTHTVENGVQITEATDCGSMDY